MGGGTSLVNVPTNCDQCPLTLCYNRVEGPFGGYKILILFV